MRLAHSPCTVRLILALAAVVGTSSFAAPVAQAQAPATPPAPAAPPLPPVGDVVNQVQAFYNATNTFVSEFNQSFYVKAYDITKKSHGVVTFAKPGKMNWSYDDPAGNRVVSDGSTLRVYEAANKQMYQQPVSTSQYPAALSFLTGQGQLSQSFTFELRAGQDMNFPGGYVLVGTPIVATSAYQKVLFYVDAQTFQIRRVLILDGQQNRNKFDFVSPSVNGPVDPNQFAFTPPPGTTVINP